MVRGWKYCKKVNEPFACFPFWQQNCYLNLFYCTSGSMEKDSNIWQILASETPREFKCCAPPLSQPQLKYPERKITWVFLRVKKPGVRSNKFCCSFNQHSEAGVAVAACCLLPSITCFKEKMLESSYPAELPASSRLLLVYVVPLYSICFEAGTQVCKGS